MRASPGSNRGYLTWLLAALPLVAGVGLCAFQFGDRNGLNNMPFAQVQPLVADLAKARQMANAGNIELLAGQSVAGKEVSLRGELTDANCFLTTHTHAYDHAFCAKLCAAAGSPLLFLPDAGGRPYLVLTEKNAVRLPDSVLDQIGVPGILIKARVLDSRDLPAIAVEGLTGR
jgi:hypothetical protein